MLDVIEELLPDVLMAAPGCPDMTAERVLSRSARQFCMDTHAWRHTSDSLAVIQGIAEVELYLPAGATLQRVFWATLDGQRLTGLSRAEPRGDPGRPQGFAVASDGQRLQLDRVPEGNYLANGVVLHAALAPKRGTALLPDELEPFLDVIAYLAIGHLLAMPSQEWSDRRGASDAMSLYHQQSIRARRQGQQFDQPIHRTVNYGGL